MLRERILCDNTILDLRGKVYSYVLVPLSDDEDNVQSRCSYREKDRLRGQCESALSEVELLLANVKLGKRPIADLFSQLRLHQCLLGRDSNT